MRTCSFIGMSVLVLAGGGCSWHRIHPHAGEAPTTQIELAMTVRPVDEDTSHNDVRKIAKTLRTWKAVREVKIVPTEHGEVSEGLEVGIGLRQTAEVPHVGNFFVGMAVGITFGLLSPAIGPTIYEVHEVSMTTRLNGKPIGKHDFVTRTGMTFGYGADLQQAARALDDEHLERVAEEILERVARDLRSRDAVLELRNQAER